MKFKLYGYGTRHCPYCVNAIDYISKNFPNTKIEKINIDEDVDAKNYIVGLGHRTVPQVFVSFEGTVETWNWIGGFDRLKEWQPVNEQSPLARVP